MRVSEGPLTLLVRGRREHEQKGVGMYHALRYNRRLISLVAAGALTALLALGLVAGASASAARGHAHKRSTARTAAGPTITSEPWGTANGQAVSLWTLRSGHEMTVRITNYGGVVQAIWVPDRRGHAANVALGFSKLSDYVNDFQNQPWPAPGGSGDTYFGAIIGRYANRIANHSFTLNGTTYNLPGNNGPNNINTLHGGPNAWNTKVWQASTRRTPDAVSLILRYVDPNGYNGFPGQVTTEVTYTVTSENALRIQYHATTTQPTVINLTNHTYFNLAGEGSTDIYDQLLQLNSSTFSPVDSTLIPTGFASVAGTPFDFRRLKPIGRDIRRADLPYGQQLVIAHGYDHNWVLNGSGLKFAARAIDPASGRELLTYTTEPGVQVYTSNFLVGDLVGASGRVYRQGDAFTLETQHYPDTPHHIGQPDWPSVVLDPGQPFRSTTIFRFGVVR
jgi:aldose 1-epimerase